MTELDDDAHNRLHPVRPKFGFDLSSGWTVSGADEPCASCGQPAATLSPDGKRIHPTCLETKKKKTTQQGEQ